MIPLSISFNHAPRHEKLQKFSGYSGKDAVDVSHTVKSVFSIVKQPQLGATADSTIFISIIIATRNKLSGRDIQALGVGRYPGSVPRRLSAR